MRNKPSITPFQAVLAALPILVASLYFFGVCFHEGFTGGMGLEGSLFPLSVDRTLFSGFFALLDLSAKQIGFFLLAAWVIAVVPMALFLLGFSNLFRGSSERLTSFFTNHKTSSSIKKERSILYNTPPSFALFSVQMFLCAVGAFFVLLVVILAGMVAEKSGRDTAKNQLEKMQQGNWQCAKLFLVGHETPINAHTILCSSSHCSFIVNSETVTYRHELIEKLVVSADPLPNSGCDASQVD